VIDDTTLK